MDNSLFTINKRLSNIESLLLDLKKSSKVGETKIDSNCWLVLVKLRKCPVRKTPILRIYHWVRNRHIPFLKIIIAIKCIVEIIFAIM